MKIVEMKHMREFSRQIPNMGHMEQKKLNLFYLNRLSNLSTRIKNLSLLTGFVR
jgi:hypothetical protein